jgi:hypothetical protein
LLISSAAAFMAASLLMPKTRTTPDFAPADLHRAFYNGARKESQSSAAIVTLFREFFHLQVRALRTFIASAW